ncbi:protein DETOXIFICATION 33-like isoform X1 [Dioscorea cayenensis subsp. rotundata]|uniref:Protein DETOXIFICATION 33-like isoform X1 n=1 Tax=Dioscorea cayennensis subsp. rotundata TaxID=55577 RepID=A0AB40BQ01_DIOCR|nr:protein DETOXIFICATION 33-like isoform X1 [Dioscorea cayenensis subsp. rotundata]
MLSPPLLRGSPHLVGVEGPGHRKLSSISDIVSQHNHLSAREPLAMLSKSLGSRWPSSVRVSNELGVGNLKVAKFSVFVVTVISLNIQTTSVIIIIVTKEDFPKLFTENEFVRERVSKVAYYLCASIFSWKHTTCYIMCL